MTGDQSTLEQEAVSGRALPLVEVRSLFSHLALLLLLLVFLGASSAGPLAGQSVSATVDRNQISFDEQILLRISIDGNQASRPRLPEMPDFHVTPRGQETSMSVVNGRMSRSVAFNYILVPRRVGEIQIGPVEVDHGETGCKTPDAVPYIRKTVEHRRQLEIRRRKK